MALYAAVDDLAIQHGEGGEQGGRAMALGRKNYLFAGSDADVERAAVIYSWIETAKLNDIDPHAWLSDIIGRIGDHPARQIDQRKRCSGPPFAP